MITMMTMKKIIMMMKTMTMIIKITEEIIEEICPNEIVCVDSFLMIIVHLVEEVVQIHLNLTIVDLLQTQALEAILQEAEVAEILEVDQEHRKEVLHQ